MQRLWQHHGLGAVILLLHPVDVVHMLLLQPSAVVQRLDKPTDTTAIFLAVLGAVASSLPCSVLPFPSRLLLICLSIRWRSVRGDVGQGFLSILDI